MYLDFLVEIPSEKGKITTKPKGNAVYVNYELSREYDRIDENPNYMTVPAAIRELEKIEMVRGHDRIYRLDHAVTKTQKVILKAFGIDAAYVKQRAN